MIPADPSVLSEGDQTRGNSKIHLVIISGWVLLAGFTLRTALLGGIGANVRAFQAAYLAGFAGYLALTWVVVRKGRFLTPHSWRWWLAGVMALRVMLLLTQPSDDTYRYLWEGRVQLAGFSPYLYAPDDPALANLRNDKWERVNHPQHRAIYPPLAQLEFAATAALWPSIYTLKTAHVVWDALVVVVLGACLRSLGRPPHAAIIYGLCPLVLSAFAIEGHVDSLMLFFAALALRSAIGKHMTLAGALIGAAISAKLVFVVLLPWLAWRHPRAAFAAVGTLALTCVPFLGGGSGQLAGVVSFGTSNEFFSLLGTMGILRFDTIAGRIATGSLLVMVLTWLTWRSRDWQSYCQSATPALLMLIPVVHYWYLTWVLLFIPFVPRWRWLVASCAMVGYFEADLLRSEAGQWSMPTWTPLLVWVTFLTALCVEALLVSRGRRHEK